MLLIIQNAIIKAPPTTVDSLRYSINKLQITVDSLQKIVLKTEIGTGFFSDVISTNLYMFATIIGLAALVSWASIAGILLYHKKVVRKDAVRIVTDTMNLVEQKIINIEMKQAQLAYDASRSMYTINEDKGHITSCFAWAISVIDSILNLIDSNSNEFVKCDYLTQLKVWVDTCISDLDKIPVGDMDVIEQIDESHRVINRLKTGFGEDIALQAGIMIKHINHIVYTIPQVPEDIMEGHDPARDIG